ncbi:MAG: PH domain-containing protein [Actinomycetota bacterium]|nr:PH domain-containing protein [Actinomycetota bacterium]
MDLPAHRLDRRVRTLWRVTASLLSLALVGGWLAGARLLGTHSMRAALVASGVVVAILAVLLVVLLPPLRYRRWRYELREADLYTARGALLRTLTVIPFDRIQYVETRQGPVARWLGLAGVMVYTAAGRAGHIPGLALWEAKRLRDELYRVAGTASV